MLASLCTRGSHLTSKSPSQKTHTGPSRPSEFAHHANKTSFLQYRYRFKTHRIPPRYRQHMHDQNEIGLMEKTRTPTMRAYVNRMLGLVQPKLVFLKKHKKRIHGFNPYAKAPMEDVNQLFDLCRIISQAEEMDTANTIDTASLAQSISDESKAKVTKNMTAEQIAKKADRKKRIQAKKQAAKKLSDKRAKEQADLDSYFYGKDDVVLG